jgi:hypothetical protein
MIPYGGSKSSGYIQMLLAKHPELFDFNKVQNPSANLRTRNEKAREAAERERMAMEDVNVVERKRRKLRKEPKEEKGQINQERNEFFKLLIKMLSSKSTRDYRKFKKENPEFADRIENIVGSQKGLDFYPTPVECLNGLEDIVGDRFTTSILEPSAGLGNILNWIEEHKNKNAKVKAIEFNRQFINPLKELFPAVDVEEGDFLEYKPATNDFDCIVCNPPFNLYKANNVYIDFLFKCLYLLSSSTKAGTVFCIFICPMLTKARHDDGDQFEFREIADKIGYNVVDRALKKVVGESLTKKEFKEYVDEGEDNEIFDRIEPAECVVVKKECKGFGGTGAAPTVYLFKIVNYRRGGKKRRC